MSSSNMGVHFGLGAQRKVDRVEIRWPSGVTQVVADAGVNRVVQVVEP